MTSQETTAVWNQNNIPPSPSNLRTNYKEPANINEAASSGYNKAKLFK